MPNKKNDPLDAVIANYKSDFTRSAVSNWINEHDPQARFRNRMIFTAGAFALFSLGAFPATAYAAQAVPAFTDVLSALVQAYPTMDINSVAGHLADGASSYASATNEALLTDNPDTKPKSASKPMPGFENVKSAYENVASALSSTWDHAKAVGSKIVHSLSPVFSSWTAFGTALVAFGRILFEVKGVYDTLKDFYERRKGIHPDQKISTLERELSDLKQASDRAPQVDLERNLDKIVSAVERANGLETGELSKLTACFSKEEKENLAIGTYVGGLKVLQTALNRYDFVGFQSALDKDKLSSEELHAKEVIRSAISDIDVTVTATDEAAIEDVSTVFPHRNFVDVQNHLKMRTTRSRSLWNITHGQPDLELKATSDGVLYVAPGFIKDAPSQDESDLSAKHDQKEHTDQQELDL